MDEQAFLETLIIKYMEQPPSRFRDIQVERLLIRLEQLIAYEVWSK